MQAGQQMRISKQEGIYRRTLLQAEFGLFCSLELLLVNQSVNI